MRRRHLRSSDAPGEDSFLDIVANLVGVLIILVVVVGAQAGASWSGSKEADEDADITDQLAELQHKVDRQQTVVKSLTLDNRELENQIRIEQQLTAAETERRRRMLAELKMVRAELDRQRSKLDQDRQLELRYAAELSNLERELESLTSQSSSITTAESKVEIIEHRPTPIAKTVFKDEVHFQLRQGKILLVPLPDLIDLMRSEWEVMAGKLTSDSRTVETVGPIGVFRLQYELKSQRVKQQTSYGPVVRQSIEFKRFVVIPARQGLGEVVETALNANSLFVQELKRLDPVKHTISVWVYPDSYAEFEQLKEWLYDRGFQTAVWPLSRNGVISGGPDGYRSTAQ